MNHPCRYLYLLLTLARGVFWGPRRAPGFKLNTGERSASNWALSVFLCLTIVLWCARSESNWAFSVFLFFFDNCVVVAAVANLATDTATSTVCASHLPRQTTKWLAYGCHTSVLLFYWCIPFLVLFQLCDVPQTLNIQQRACGCAYILMPQPAAASKIRNKRGEYKHLPSEMLGFVKN